jgi:hypothetical protein
MPAYKGMNKESKSKVEEHPVPEHVLIAAKDLCEYISPSNLASLVEEWADEKDTLPLAQIALDAGVRNCGLKQLAGYFGPSSEFILNSWKEDGLILPSLDDGHGAGKD